MPQFELDAVGPSRASGLVRGRTPEAAVQDALAGTAAEGAAVALDPPEAGSGWQAVTLDGQPAGRVRAQARMRFRRD